MKRHRHAENTHVISDLEALQGFARKLGARLRPKEIVLLKGRVGAGKTQFVRFLVEALGSREAASPSFAIHHAYVTTKGIVDHLDLYRLESEEELESTGFWDLFARASGFVIIEWAERLDEKLLPPNWPLRELEFFVDEPGGRRVIRESVWS